VDKNKEVRGKENLVDVFCLKCSKTHLQASLIQKNVPGVTPRTPLKGGGKTRGNEERGSERAISS